MVRFFAVAMVALGALGGCDADDVPEGSGGTGNTGGTAAAGGGGASDGGNGGGAAALDPMLYVLAVDETQGTVMGAFDGDGWTTQAFPSEMGTYPKLAAGSDGTALAVTSGESAPPRYSFKPRDGAWTSFAPVPTAGSVPGSYTDLGFAHGVYVYLFVDGGGAAFHLFDPATSTWANVTMLTSFQGTPALVGSAISADEAFLAMTGGGNLYSLIFDPLQPPAGATPKTLSPGGGHNGPPVSLPVHANGVWHQLTLVDDGTGAAEIGAYVDETVGSSSVTGCDTPIDAMADAQGNVTILCSGFSGESMRQVAGHIAGGAFVSSGSTATTLADMDVFRIFPGIAGGASELVGILGTELVHIRNQTGSPTTVASASWMAAASTP